LVLAWLTGVFFLLRWLWRQAVALMEALSEAATAAGAAWDAQDAWRGANLPEVAIFAKAEEIAARWDARGERIAGRRARRRARHQAAYDSWAVLAGYRDA
jgi:hypothetical protein